MQRRRPTWDQYFINIAEVVATRSHDIETQVGCVLVSPNRRIISAGYNGFPPGFDDENLPNTRPEKYKYMVHAEANAIAFARRSLNDCTLYCTLTPCEDCIKLILTCGIKRFVCKKKYKGWDKVADLLRFSKIYYKVENEPEIHHWGLAK